MSEPSRCALNKAWFAEEVRKWTENSKECSLGSWSRQSGRKRRSNGGSFIIKDTTDADLSESDDNAASLSFIYFLVNILQFLFPYFFLPSKSFYYQIFRSAKKQSIFFFFCRSLMLLFERFFFFLFYFFFFSFAYHPILPLYLVHRGAGSGGVYPRR